MAAVEVMLAAVLLSTAGLAWLWVAVAWRPRTLPPRCGRCGYSVVGLESMSCPECGSDFREVGIATGGRPPIAWAVFLLLWTLLLPAPALVATAVAWRGLPRRAAFTSTIRAVPRSGAFPPISITLMAHARTSMAAGVSSTSGATIAYDSARDATSVTMNSIAAFVPSDVRVEVIVHDTRGVARVLRLTAASSVDPGPRTDEIEPWLDSLDDRPAPRELAEDARDVARLITALHATGTFTSSRLSLTGGVSGVRVSRHEWFKPTATAVWITVWAGGILLFASLRRRSATRADGATAPRTGA